MVIRAALIGALLAAVPTPLPGPAPASMAWPSREMPLPISVRSPQDLTFKTEVERQYLIFNLMAAGRVAYEAGDFARAAHEWEALLKLPNLPPEVARAVALTTDAPPASRARLRRRAAGSRRNRFRQATTHGRRRSPRSQRAGEWTCSRSIAPCFRPPSRTSGNDGSAEVNSRRVRNAIGILCPVWRFAT
jgi:hypothetical protein